MTLTEQVEAVQAKLGLVVDGKPGPKTWAAIYSAIIGAEPQKAVPIIGAVDARSERMIVTLLPEVQPYARTLVHLAADKGITIIVTSGMRTYEEQNDLYEIGRSRPDDEGRWKTVTNARGGFSNHNFAIGFDVTVFKSGSPVWESPAYNVVGAIGKSIGLEWGGDWHSLEDDPHFELHPAWAKGLSESAMLAELRRRHDAGQGIFA